MTALRLRILLLMLFTGLMPLIIFVTGIRFLPGGVLPWLWFAMISVCVTVLSVGMCGLIARPLKDAIVAMRSLMINPASAAPRTWVP
ncbi:MAG: hypothetical protein JWR77_2582, partial [Rhizorhabdus sp.]|nr:hypothetical protein [Rhizorhabdus sp.]